MITVRDRYKSVLQKNGLSITKFAESYGEATRAKINRQINGDTTVTFDVLQLLLERFPEVSADWLMRGEGLQERTKIVVPPTQHHQDIHIEGGTAAISQSGTATVAPQVDQPKEQDIAQMIRDNDLGGLVAIIMKQKDEIIRLKEQRIHDLEVSVRIADNQLFQPVK